MRKFFPNSWGLVDIGLHVAVGIVVMLGLLLGGKWAIAGIHTVFWLYRELEQHDWKIKTMGGQSHAEWLAPGIVGFIVAAIV